jgi:hypothetical protein
VELLLFGLRTRIDLQLVFNYFSTHPDKIAGGLGKEIIVLVEELQELRLLSQTHVGANANDSV